MHIYISIKSYYIYIERERDLIEVVLMELCGQREIVGWAQGKTKEKNWKQFLVSCVIKGSRDVCL